MKHPVKVVIGGAGAIGKTTLCKRLTGDLDQENLPTMTPGVEIHKFECKDENNIVSTIWDLGGQERFRFIQDTYICGAKILILVFSVEWIHSVKDLSSWLKLIPQSNPPKKIFLVGNKIDSPRRVVLKDDVEDLIEKYDMEYFELSALRGQGVSEFKARLKEAVAEVREKFDLYAELFHITEKKKYSIES
jgi:small GTP-binding protein